MTHYGMNVRQLLSNADSDSMQLLSNADSDSMQLLSNADSDSMQLLRKNASVLKKEVERLEEAKRLSGEELETVFREVTGSSVN